MSFAATAVQEGRRILGAREMALGRFCDGHDLEALLRVVVGEGLAPRPHELEGAVHLPRLLALARGDVRARRLGRDGRQCRLLLEVEEHEPREAADELGPEGRGERAALDGRAAPVLLHGDRTG